MTLSPEQIAIRREGITATDIGCIVGANPYRKPIDVWQEKRGIAPPYEEKPATRWGHKLEPMVLEEYEETHRVRVERCGTFRHRTNRWAMATPDAKRYPLNAAKADGGLEVKTHGDEVMRFGPGMEYGAEGTDEVPLHELCQCAWGMYVTELPRWDLILFDQRPRLYIIDRDDELIEMLVDQGQRFRRDYLESEEHPPPDGSESWNEFLKRKFAENNAQYIDADRNPDLLALVHQLRDARAANSDAERLAEQLAQRVKNAIGDRSGITFHEPDRAKAVRIHWKWAKAGTQKAWQSSFESLKASAGLFVSARRAEAEAATSSLLTPGAQMNPAAIAQLLHDAFALLGDIAIAEVATTTKKAGRPFNVPRHWPKSAGEITTETEENA